MNVKKILSDLNYLHFLGALLTLVSRIIYIIGVVSFTLILILFGTNVISNDLSYLLYVNLGVFMIPILIRLYLKFFIDKKISLREQALAKSIIEQDKLKNQE